MDVPGMGLGGDAGKGEDSGEGSDGNAKFHVLFSWRSLYFFAV